MPIFKYKAKNNTTGRSKSEMTVALNQSDLVTGLHRSDYNIISIADVSNSWEAKINLILNPIKVKDLVIELALVAVQEPVNSLSVFTILASKVNSSESPLKISMILAVAESLSP